MLGAAVEQAKKHPLCLSVIALLVLTIGLALASPPLTALAAVLTTCRGGEAVLVPQWFWRDHDAYDVHCPGHYGGTWRVAVSRTLRSYPLTVNGASYRSGEISLDAYGEISRRENFHPTKYVAADYIAFVAGGFSTERGPYLASIEEVESVLATPWPDDPFDVLAQRNAAYEPKVTVGIEGPPFVAVAYQWAFWIGEVRLHEFRAEEDGAIRFRMCVVGWQPNMAGRDVERCKKGLRDGRGSTG